MYLIPDVNVIAAALIPDHGHHADSARWLESAVNSGCHVGLLPETLSGVVRVATLSGWATPVSAAEVGAAIEKLLDSRQINVVRPVYQQIRLFLSLCRSMPLRGNDAGDGLLAAAAIDLDATLVTWDSDFSRFPRLRWQRPGDTHPVTNPR